MLARGSKVRARGLGVSAQDANQRHLNRLQASRLVNLLRDNDLAAWILELPTGADEKQTTTNTTNTTEGNVRCEVLVAVKNAGDAHSAMTRLSFSWSEPTVA